MRFHTTLLHASLLLFAVTAAIADTVTLRSGQKIDGTFFGGTARQLQFQDSNGKTLTLPIGDVAGATFTAPPPPPPPPKANGPSVQLPVGTVLHVRVIDAINVDLSKPGQTYRASIDDPIMLGGNVVIPRGADVTLQAAAVKQAGKLKGNDEISLKINSIAANGKRFDVVTDAVTQKGGSEGKKTARRAIGVAGLGAAIGGIAGGGQGAAIGAAAGAGAGLAASAGGQTLKIPSETRLQFRLSSAVNIT
ncbi:MAG TPA: hypothetical protein VEX68_10040 [Bryobacteraceae bacterium]|nr:hypothetical protein [Bryobacteraceae bacterium]